MIRELYARDWFAKGRKVRFSARRAKVRYETELMLEELTYCAPVFPAANNGTQYTNTIDMSKYNRCMFTAISGTVGGGGNIVFQAQQTNNSNGQSNTNIATTNSGTGTAATIVGSSQAARIEVRADQMTARYLQFSGVVNTNQSTWGGFAQASEARQHPAGTTVGNSDSSLLTTGGVLNQFYA